MHYGTNGQRWGVRRYQNEDGTLTAEGKQHYGVHSGGNVKLRNKYIKDINSLRKLTDRANLNLQKKNAAKHNKRAKIALGVGITGAAAALTGDIAYALRKKSIINNPSGGKPRTRVKKIIGDAKDAKVDKSHSVGKTADASLQGKVDYMKELGLNYKNPALHEGARTSYNMHAEEKRKALAEQLKSEAKNTKKKFSLYDVNVALAVGGFSAAAYQKTRAIIAKNRTTEKGHARAVAKRQELYEKLKNTYSGTPYADLLIRADERLKNRK